MGRSGRQEGGRPLTQRQRNAIRPLKTTKPGTRPGFETKALNVGVQALSVLMRVARRETFREAVFL